MQPHLTTETYLESVWRAARAGALDWSEVQQLQNGLMPRCANHPDRPAPVYLDGVAACADCVAVVVAARKEQ